MVHKLCRFIQLAEILKALGHPVRLCVINRLLAMGPSSAAALRHCLRQPQSSVTRHLQRLLETGLIRSEFRGQERLYSISGDFGRDFLEAVFDYDDKRKLADIAKRYNII
ncbi:MAG: metalloregulator ArsR/SmtB family transcription factor [Deltaproteobacteria bacterium]|jgi:ArsR family transcriptional regulator|nr:metalloregulator ArsR/SmtB family transcription factor [Deltaproteobacteria bacterium]